jgi:hypothetical protein
MIIIKYLKKKSKKFQAHIKKCTYVFLNDLLMEINLLYNSNLDSVKYDRHEKLRNVSFVYVK